MSLLRIIETILFFCSKCKLKSECCEKEEETANHTLKKSACFKFKYNADSTDVSSNESEEIEKS